MKKNMFFYLQYDQKMYLFDVKLKYQ